MATPSESEAAEAPPEQGKGKPWARRVALWLVTGVAGLLAAIALFIALLDTGPGRRVVADWIGAIGFQNGLKITVGRIDGSLYGEMVLQDVSLKDPKGEFLYLPALRVDWRPLRYFGNHLDIRSAIAERAYLRRVPSFKVTPATNQPLLPDLDIDISKLEVGHLIVQKAVTGEERIATITGTAHIASGRAQVTLGGHTHAVGKTGGGDTLLLVLDAVPEANRLALDLSLKAPRGGVIAAMAGLQAPLAMTVKGKGDWKAWDGTLNATYNAKALAGLTVTGRDGVFALRGPMHLGQMFTGPVAGLLGPVATLDLAATLGHRSARLSGGVTSETMRLDTDGGISLADNSFDALALRFRLLRPSSLAKGLQGSGLSAHVTLNGTFKAPRIAYALAADRLAMNGMGLEQLAARGEARVDPNRMTIPLAARVRRITGLDSVAGGSLANVRLDGDLAIKGPRVMSDNMRLRSDRLDAKAVLLANLSTGLYTGGINGRIDRYRIESVAVLRIESDVRVESGAHGFALTGTVRARSTRLLNPSLEQYLGGNFAASANVRYGGDGRAQISNLRLAAPDLSVTGGSGSYEPGGRIRLVADARSDRYGKLGVRVTGTLANPDAHLVAEHPGMGIGLVNLDAKLAGAGAGYRLALTGDTDYGPLAADVTLARATGAIAINSASLSGIAFTGSLSRTREGPFTGTLKASGNGLGGTVMLSPSGRWQRAEFHVRANGSRFRGPAHLKIGSAIIDGYAILYDQPEVVADLQIGDTRYRGWSLAAVRAQVDYRGGTGKAKALIEGARRTPFRLAVNAVLAPQLWQVMLDGKSRGVEFRTAAPARIRPTDGTYELLPTTIKAGEGTIRLAGSYGAGLKIETRVEGVDIAMANAFLPGMGLGGTATGSLDFTQANATAFPRADARLKLSNFTRTSSATVSQPVDVNLIGQLLPDGGKASAVIRQRGSVVGRVVANLRPLPPGTGSWTTRLTQAPLSGGIRYNGPAATVFSLAGQPGQSLDGPLGIAADFSCSLSAPCLKGVVRGSSLTYQNDTYGTRLTGMDLSGRFNGDRLQIDSMKARAGNGTVSASGSISLASSAGYPMDITATLDNASLANSDALSASATGTLRLTKVAGQKTLLSGQLVLPDARYKVVREGAAQVPQLTGVTFKPRRGPQRITGDEPAAPMSSLFDTLRLDLKVNAPDRLFVSGMGLESEWRANFALGGTTAAPTMTGKVSLVRGTLSFAGRSFDLQEGQIDFSGGTAYDPSLRIVASQTVDSIAINLTVTGRASNPQIAFTSVPALPQDEIMSRILFGSSISNLSAIQAIQLAASLNSLRGAGGGLNPLGKLRTVAGIDRLRILGADQTTGRGTALAAGKYITNDIYVELITDTRGFTATQLDVSLTPWLSLLSQAGGSGTSNVSLRVHKDY